MSDNAAIIDLADMICLTRLRWDFARRRPQHLMSRSARERRVFYVEDPIFREPIPGLDIRRGDSGVFVVTPHLREGPDDVEAPAMEQALLLDELFLEYDLCDYVLWYYTSAAMAFTWRLDPLLVVYDCIDEPPSLKSLKSGKSGKSEKSEKSGKSGNSAPPSAKQREAELLKLADVVFTSGHSLYESMRHLHHNIHLFPGPFSVDETPASSSAWDDAWARMMNLINLTFNNRYSEDRASRR